MLVIPQFGPVWSWGGPFPGPRHCRRNLTPPSSVYEAVSMSLFSAPDGHNELSQRKGEFPFSLTAKLTMAFFDRSIIART